MHVSYSLRLYCTSQGYDEVRSEVPYKGQIQRKTWCMGPCVEVDSITSPYVHSRVDSSTFIMGKPLPESTLSPSHGLWIFFYLTWVSCGISYNTYYFHFTNVHNQFFIVIQPNISIGGYKDFFNLHLLRPFMVTKLNSLRHIYKKVFPFFSAVLSAFVFKVCKKYKYDFFNIKKAIQAFKNAEFIAHFESVEKVGKKSIRFCCQH